MPIRPRKVLMITYYYPPIKSIGVMRSYQISCQFAQQMEEVIVLTTSNRHHLQQEALPLPAIQIEELMTFDYRRIFSLISGKKKTHQSAKSKASRLARLWLLLKDSFPTNLLLDEGGPFYVLHGFLKARRLIRSKEIPLIYSSFRPYADHLIAWLLKFFYPHLYWIADFRDLQIDLNRKNVYGPKLQHWFNRKILSRADLVLTVSDGLAAQLKNYHPNVVTLRNGVHFRQSAISTSSRFTLAYTGSIYPGFQSPECLLEALSELLEEGLMGPTQLQLIYAGKDSAVWQDWINKYQLQHCFDDRGLVPLAEALEIQEQAQINLLLSWAGPQLKGILTGKFYEYLGAQNPILLIIRGDEDQEFEELFDRLQAGKVVYENRSPKAELKRHMQDLFEEWKTGKKQGRELKIDELKKMTWKTRVEEIFERIQSS